MGWSPSSRRNVNNKVSSGSGLISRERERQRERGGSGNDIDIWVTMFCPMPPATLGERSS
ncbi:hypothetical protein J6590_034225 [Homalodisca vitripennis]|nr:hypothetical protein J6590_034225 [Homalodisca vitripennis]